MQYYFEWQQIVESFCDWMGVSYDVQTDLEVVSAIYVTRQGLLIQGVSERHPGISLEVRINMPIDPAKDDIGSFLDSLYAKTGWGVNAPEEKEAARQYLHHNEGVMIICRYSRMIVPLCTPQPI